MFESTANERKKRPIVKNKFDWMKPEWEDMKLDFE